MELEIVAIVNIYDAILAEFYLDYNLNLTIYKIYGDINDNNKILLTLCLINNNHYVVVYENNNNINNNTFIDIKKLENNVKMNIKK